MFVKLLSSATMVVLLATTICAEEISMENSALKVSVNKENGVFSIQSKVTGKVFVTNARVAGKIKSVQPGKVKDETWGKGKGIVLEHEDGSLTSLRLFRETQFLRLHTEVNNPGKEPLKSRVMDILDMDVSLEGRTLVSFGTGGLSPLDKLQTSFCINALVDPKTRNGVVTAWLTHNQGVGVFLPKHENNITSIASKIDFGNYMVKPGEKRNTETLLIGYFDDARLGLEGYASAVAEHYDIRLRPKPGVYCTWYHSGASNQDDLAANTEFAEKNLKPYGLSVMQIDDKWQDILPKGFKHEGDIKTTGPIKVFVDTKSNYSKGMAHTAKNITSHGMVAGIWFMPFAGNFRNPYFDKDIFAKNADGTPYHDKRWSGTCIDMSHPKAQKFVYDRVKRIYDWGYRYFKIDGMHTGMPSYNRYVDKVFKKSDFGNARLHDPSTTLTEAYRYGLQVLHAAAPEAFVLGCNVSQNMRSMGPAFGLVDAMRIGPDNGSAGRGDWKTVKKGAWHGGNLYFLNGKVWYNDPDPVYVRSSNPLAYARWMCSWLAVSGGMHTSSEQYNKLDAERLDILKRCLPVHELQARPVDLFDTNEPQIWLVQNERVNVLGLFNWHDKETADISYDMAKLGLDGGKTYVAFDFWQNKFVDDINGTLKQSLPGGTCRILAVKEKKDHPQLLGTSRNITQGLIDVKEEKWSGRRKTLSGKSRVVGGDPYELRIALPSKGEWKVEKVSANGADIKVGKACDKGVRIAIDSPKSMDVEWKIKF